MSKPIQNLALDEIIGLFSFETLKNEMSDRLIEEASRTEFLYDLDDIARDKYRLTSNVITSINQTWKKEDNPKVKQLIELRNSVPAFMVGDAQVAFAAFANVIKKHTAPLRLHELFDRQIREHVKQLSSDDVERQIVIGFYKSMMQQNNPDVNRSVLNAIPNTKLGEKFCQHFFNVTRAELLNESVMLEILPEVQMRAEDLSTLPIGSPPKLERHDSPTPTSIAELIDDEPNRKIVSAEEIKQNRNILIMLRSDPQFSIVNSEDQLEKTCEISTAFRK